MWYVYWCKTCREGWFEEPEHEHPTEIAGWMEDSERTSQPQNG